MGTESRRKVCVERRGRKSGEEGRTGQYPQITVARRGDGRGEKGVVERSNTWWA